MVLFHCVKSELDLAAMTLPLSLATYPPVLSTRKLRCSHVLGVSKFLSASPPNSHVTPDDAPPRISGPSYMFSVSATMQLPCINAKIVAFPLLYALNSLT